MHGLLSPAPRKNVEQIAEQVAPEELQQLHHFVSTSPWKVRPVQGVLWERAREIVGGEGAVLSIDDTSIVKQGKHSVGVARQYCGELGKQANCQVLVSLTMDRGGVPVPVALRLFLPKSRAEDPVGCEAAGIPEAERRCLPRQGPPPSPSLPEIRRRILQILVRECMPRCPTCGRATAPRQRA
ncbi:MAG: transposase [Gemmatimonadetes bacterium]|nr:transposase [Gemmatimonadota bacterium]